MRRLVSDLAFHFHTGDHALVRRAIEDYGRSRGVMRAAALAARVGDHVMGHYPSVVYASWVRFMDPEVAGEPIPFLPVRPDKPTLAAVGAVPLEVAPNIDSIVAEIVDHAMEVRS